MTRIRILGIDPGFDRLGVCILDKEGNKETVVTSLGIITSKTETFEDRLLYLADGVEKLIREHKPDHLAIETLFVTKNQKTAMLVACVRGVIIYLCKKHGLLIFEYSPPQIKLAVTGYGQAKKEDVAYMVSKILHITFDKKQLDDEIDAIAIALTHSAHYKASLWK